MILRDITLPRLLAACKARGFPVLAGENFVNTFGIRAANARAGRFDDAICQLYWVKNEWALRVFKATTDPGLTYLEKPLNAKGTAIMVPGFYPKAYQLGLHKGKPALRQIGPLKVYRDNNRDAILDMNPATIETGTGMLCNIHYSQGEGQLDIVGPWSAGCQVLSAGVNSPLYQKFLTAYQYAAPRNGNLFDYGLLREQDLPAMA